MTYGMHSYYEQQDVLPTFARLADEAALDAYARQREHVYVDRLLVPPAVFRGAEVLEFGPDSGENALVFARWGATMTLVEPNRRAWPMIEGYFDRFGLRDRLDRLCPETLQQFASDRRFDIVDAEGFIYTVQPTSLWLERFRELLRPGGLAVISYVETSGALFELSLKLVHAQTKRLTGLAAVEAARSTFAAKWDTIPHTRAFESWVMDVLENPFVRLNYLLDAAHLRQQIREAGLGLYSSWPSYRDATAVDWHKAAPDPDRRLTSDLDFIARSRLGFLLGARAFLTGPPDETEPIAAAIVDLVGAIDVAIDDPTLAGKAAEDAEGLLDLVRPAPLVADDAEAGFKKLEMLQELLSLVAEADAEKLRRFCTTDAVFLSTWGLPTHFAVIRR